MSWWTEHRKYANPAKLVEKGIHEINQALGWDKPGDGPQGVDVSAHYNTAIDENMIKQNYASQELAEINNKSDTWEDYANNLQDAKYISQEIKDKALQQTNGGTTMANTATNQQEQNWFERNSEYIMPLLSTALTTATQMWYNDYQQDKQNSYNAEQAQINRDWQEQMSNTAITRQVQDLQNAGINPLLASQLGGSAVTSGGQASSAGLMPMNMKDMISTARTGAEIENINADTDLKYKNSGKSEEEMKMIQFDRKFKEETRHIEIALQNYKLTKLQYEQMIDDATSRIYAAEAGIAEAEEKTVTRNRRWHEIRDSITSFIPFASPVASSAVKRPTVVNNF